MGTKYLINSTDNVVISMLEGVVAANKKLTLYAKQNVVLLKRLANSRVHIISGGGSGHEPFAAGYVGDGMLSGAVAGAIFTSPPSQNIQDAIEGLSSEKNSGGILVIIPNYTGDVLNFGIACEKARSNGCTVESVVIGEDCALLGTGHSTLAGRRGMCGIVLVIKIAGAMAIAGKSLEEIVRECHLLLPSMATLGVCMEPCSIPGNKPMFKLGDDEFDLGLGIHGEAGISRIKAKSAEEIVNILLDKISTVLSFEVNKVCALINNLGSLTQLEMGIIQSEVQKYFDRKQIQVYKIYAGHFMTSLDMKGIQICILRLDNLLWLKWLEASTFAPAWPRSTLSSDVPKPIEDYRETPQVIGTHGSFEEIFLDKKNKWTTTTINSKELSMVKECLLAAASQIQNAEKELNELDTICGDGDCGSTLSRLAAGVLKLSELKEYIQYPIVMFNFLENWANSQMGGTSGALYSLLFISAAAWISEHQQIDWVQIFKAGVNGVMKYSAARKGDRTMLDVLITCKEVLEKSHKNQNDLLEELEKSGREACEATKEMLARAGRASNVDANLIKNVDAGARGSYLWISAIIQCIQRNV